MSIGVSLTCVLPARATAILGGRLTTKGAKQFRREYAKLQQRAEAPAAS
jgi:hypothetical protein